MNQALSGLSGVASPLLLGALSPFGSSKEGRDKLNNDLEESDPKNLTLKLDSSLSRDITSEERANLEQHRQILLNR